MKETVRVIVLLILPLAPIMATQVSSTTQVDFQIEGSLLPADEFLACIRKLDGLPLNVSLIEQCSIKLRKTGLFTDVTVHRSGTDVLFVLKTPELITS